MLRIQKRETWEKAGFSDYLDRLLKLIPAEVIGLYLVGAGLVPAEQWLVATVWFGICLAAVFAVRMYGTANEQGPDWAHVAISLISFAIWVYQIGGVFEPIYVPYIGSLLVLAWTFFVPYLYRGKR